MGWPSVMCSGGESIVYSADIEQLICMVCSLHVSLHMNEIES